MSANTEQRKLAAIMFTDMVGFSALSQRKESLALELLEEHRRVVRSTLPSHNGREVKTTGDGFLIEFPSALAAVQCAVGIQNALHERNLVSPPERQIRIRIGIHVGDVVMREGDIHGDGVNIAARIEPLAPSGGICVSNAVFEQVRNKLEQGFASLGPAELKNIELPVAVHRVVMPWEGTETSPLPAARRRGQAMLWKYALSAAGILILVSLLAWHRWGRSTSSPGDLKPAGSTATVAAPATAARQLAAQAEALIADDFNATRESYALAEELCQKALGADSGDAEIWALAARISVEQIFRSYDMSAQRNELAREQAQRALKLSPSSINAGLAAVAEHRRRKNYDEADRMLRELLVREPANRRGLRLAAELARLQKNDGAVADYLARLQALPGGDPVSLFTEAHHLINQGRYMEAGAFLDRVIAKNPGRLPSYEKFYLLVRGWADYEAARKFLAQIPQQFLDEDSFVAMAARMWILLGDGDAALKALARVPREYLEEFGNIEPKGYLAGWAQKIAGRSAAATLEWQQALAQVQKRLSADPKNLNLLELKALLEASLGLKAEAQATMRLGVELGDQGATWQAQVLTMTGEVESAIATLEAQWPNLPFHLRSYLRGDLAHDPQFAAIRDDPRVQRMIAEHSAALEAMKGVPRSSPVVADEKSVAVLAFANLSEDKANEYFSDGISEELLNVLAKVPGLKVTARTSSFHFKGKDTPIPEIARQLGVAYVVEGSVRKAGDKVRITAQLIKAADGFHVWSDTFTRDLKDVFAVQDEIAGLVAQSLSLKLGAAGASAAIHPEAFRLYLEGRKEWSLRTEVSLAKAAKLFTQAIGLDPKFARAHAGLADVWMVRADALERENRNADAEYAHTSEALDRALQLDPELAEAYATRGNYFNHKEQYAEAEQAFKRAIALNPNYASAHQWYGRLLFALGNVDAGLAELELATRLDPLSPIITSNYGMLLGFARRWSESLTVCDRVLAMQPTFEQALGARAWALSHLDRKPEALAIIQAALDSPEDSPADTNHTPYMLTLLAFAGDRVSAERLAGPILAGASRNSAGEVFALFLAFNRTEEAFTYLEQSKYRFKQSDVVKLLNPVYDLVRDDPRFIRKLDEAGYLAAYKDVWAQYLAWKRKSGQP